MAINFVSIVEQLLLEDPDECVFNPKDTQGRLDDFKTKYEHGWKQSNARPFFVSKYSVEDENGEVLKFKPAFFISNDGYDTHADLGNSIESGSRKHYKTDPQTASILKKYTYTYPDYYTIGNDYIVGGRVWWDKKYTLISFWKLNRTQFSQYILPNMHLLNPKNKPVWIQLPSYDSSRWISLENYLKIQPPKKKENPLVVKLRKAMQALIPQLHLATGAERIKIKTKITEIKKKISNLTGEDVPLEDPTDNSALKGSVRYARIAAGQEPIASVKAQALASESIQ